MLLKKADDQSKRLMLLQELQQSNILDDHQKRWAAEQHSMLSKGRFGEQDAAFYIESHFKDSPHHLLLHDLRFVVDDDVAQIDHLVINRGFEFYLIETKNFAGDLYINERGEFTLEYGSKRFGIPSPLEQSRRHERILNKLLQRLDIGPRLGSSTVFHHVVVMHPKAIIHRPPPKILDTSMVIKADQIGAWHQQFTQSASVGQLLRLMANFRSTDTHREWAHKLMRQHRPSNQLRLPDFMQPQSPAVVQHVAEQPTPSPASTPLVQPKASTPVTRPVTPSASAQTQGSTPRHALAPPAPQPEPLQAPKKQLLCAHCGDRISLAEGRFCWNRAQRFGGVQYCRTHQSLF